MDISSLISLVSFLVTLLALLTALVQVAMQLSLDSRRKGKTDFLALGSWAIPWPQMRLFIHRMLLPFGLSSPNEDPRLLTVPIITIKAIQEYLHKEAYATGRRPIKRRMQERLRENASHELMIGRLAFQQTMYDLRSTTRKRSESCWSDLMDMCGFTRQYWPCLTEANAPSCDGIVRPANAITNLHSLSWFARIMGLRDWVRGGTTIAFRNVAASVYYDVEAGINRPTRLAHFNGSPGGRYMIIDDMSQTTGQSVYAESVWSYGVVPLAEYLEVHWPPREWRDGPISKHRIIWPDCKLELKDFKTWHTTTPTVEFVSWAKSFLLGLHHPPTGIHGEEGKKSESIVEFVKARSAALVSCIRTYPHETLNPSQLAACNDALSWCIKHHWLNPYNYKRQLTETELREQQTEDSIPRLPLLELSVIGGEFVTGIKQAREWCEYATSPAVRSVSVDRDTWERCKEFIGDTRKKKVLMDYTVRRTLVQILQGWKLFLLYFDTTRVGLRAQRRNINGDVVTTQLVLLTMALVALADSTNSPVLGAMEENKVLEVELG